MNPTLPAPKETVVKEDPRIPEVLPHERMYSIQIGERLFKLSGASLSYDSPSYFTKYFQQEENEYKVLFIDRSPRVFEKICMHLQGYYIDVKDEFEYLYLYADASYFHLEKLRHRLLDDGLFVNVGGQSFRIPKVLITQSCNSPNYFSVIYDTLFSDPFISSKMLLRPPSMSPLTVHRSPLLFGELLEILFGHNITINDDSHRKALINEAKYYSFFALVQQLIKVDIRSSPFTGNEQIVIDYDNVSSCGLSGDLTSESIVQYSRPYIDEGVARDLVLQIVSHEVTLLINTQDGFCSLSVTGKTAKKLNSLLMVLSDDVIYDDTGDTCKLTLLIHMKSCFTVLNGSEMPTNWMDKLVNASKTPADVDMADFDLPHLQEKRPKVISVKLLKSQWNIVTSGKSRIWGNGLLAQGVTDEMHFNHQRGWI